MPSYVKILIQYIFNFIAFILDYKKKLSSGKITIYNQKLCLFNKIVIFNIKFAWWGSIFFLLEII